MVAAQAGNVEVVDLLLQNPKTQVNLRSDEGLTELGHAVFGNSARIIGMLIDRGCDPTITNIKGTPPLVAAAYYKQKEAIAALLASPMIELDQTNAAGDAAIHWAVRTNSIPIATLLLDNNADGDLPGSFLVTPLMLAAHKGYEKMVHLLLTRVSPIVIDRADSQGETALLAASISNNAGVVRQLLRHGADPSVYPRHHNVREKFL